MATTTPNFGWPVPTSTDLVKDGATAIEALGDGIDTSLVDLKGGTTGQVLAKATNADMDFAWVAQDDSNAIQNTIVDAKGDLIAASAADTPACIAFGANGETLVADSSTSTGLRYQGNFAAGKNKIINGDFGIWQRGTTFTNVASGTFIADRFAIPSKSGTHTTTVTQQTFTPGTAPVSGYEGQYFLQMATSGYSSGDYYFGQKIEDVRTFAGQTVTYSYWARVTSGTFTPARVFLNQQFGSGGSAEVDNIGLSTPTYTTTWTRFTQTVAVPSIAGKTIGTGSNLWLLFQMVPSGNPTIQIWGVQVEASNTATAFQTATGTIQGELAACQRYCIVYGEVDLRGGATSTTSLVRLGGTFPVRMRVAPSVSMFAGTTYSWYDANTVGTFTALSGWNATVDSFAIDATAATGTTAQYRPIMVIKQGSSGKLEVTAEL